MTIQQVLSAWTQGPIRPRDIRKLLNSKKPTSAPGPDGLMYGMLRKLPSTHHILATLFTKLIFTGEPPKSWSKSTVTLIHKAGDTDDPGNFRMISLTSCVGKLFHQILSDRISEYLIRNNLLDSHTQKAFLKGINGCIEHTLVMGELLSHAKRNKRTIHVTYFDLADAFGSVEHNLINFALQRNKIPKTVCTYISNLYSQLEGTVRGPNWTSKPFNFKRGVFQGDPLSPIIFLLVFNPIIQVLKNHESLHGYNMEGEKYITLPFADDFCLITSDKRKHQKIMGEIHEITKSMNLTLKPSKCKSISICSGKPNVCQFKIGDNVLKTTKEAPQKFLGKYITHGFKSKDVYDIIQSNLSDHISNINKSQVRNEFKLRVYIQYSIPSLRYMFSVHELTDTQLTTLDHIHTNAIKSWLNVPKYGSIPAILYSPDGLSFPKLSGIYLEAHTLSYARCLVKGDKRVIHALQCKIEHESSWKQKMKAFGSRRWNQHYHAACEASSPTPNNSSRWNVVKANVKQNLKTEREHQWRDTIKPLLVQGNMLKLIDAENSDLTWKSIIYNLPRGVLSFAVKATIDFLPTFTNLRTWGKRINVKCNLCKNTQTLLHVLNNCSISLNQGRYTWRHDSILSHIVLTISKLIPKEKFTMYADIPGYKTNGGTIPPNILPTSLKPDIVIVNNTEKSVHIFELTVPFETNINSAHERKISKYLTIQSDIIQNGYKCFLNCFEIGARGLVTSENMVRMKQTFKFIGQKSSKSMIKELSKISLISSYSIWNARHEPNWDAASYLKI